MNETDTNGETDRERERGERVRERGQENERQHVCRRKKEIGYL